MKIYSQILSNNSKTKTTIKTNYPVQNITFKSILIPILLSLTLAQSVLAEGSTSASYRLDYARFNSDAEQKNSASYTLTDSISDISVEGASSSYRLRNVYSAGSVATIPVCGNGVIETGEQCEGVNFGGLSCGNYGYTCGPLQCVNCLIVTTSCYNCGGGGGSICGDGVRDASEQCDDGNKKNGDGCSVSCRIEQNICGNGIKEMGEECDDGNINYNDGCTPMCTLEVPPGPGPTPPGPTPPGPTPPGPTPPGPTPEPAPEPEPEEPLKPAAPTLTTITQVLSKHAYHFENYGTDQVIYILDETPFVATNTEPNGIYEMVVLDENGNVVTRQGVQSTPEGMLMFEVIPFLEYKSYDIALFDKERNLYRSWPIIIEDKEYREHDNLFVNEEISRDYIALGSFGEFGSLSGIGETRTKYHAYVQKIEEQDKEISKIDYMTAEADENGNYKIVLPENPEDGTYIMHVVQVYEDSRISRNQRYIFDINHPGDHRNPWPLIAIFTILIMGQLTRKNIKKGHKMRKLLSAIIALCLIMQSTAVYAVVTTPSVFVYEGKLLDSTNTPIITAQTFRFSLWISDDFVGTDITGAGAIDVTAPNYGGWFETHTLTPNSDGTFFAELGSVTPLPNMLLASHQHLMVEIKVSGAADTTYELLDPTGDNGVDTDDRQTIGSVPYTNNADFIDNAEIGTVAGDLAVLGIGNVWDIAYIPGGTNADSWTMDVDDTVGAGGTIDLTFGTTLAQFLRFDVTSDWFEFSNDLLVNGDISQNGNILTMDTDNVGVGADVDIVANQGADNDGTLRYNATTNRWEISNDAGAFNKIIAGTVPWSDIESRVKRMTFNPEFADATAEPDGTNNRCTLVTGFVDGGGTAKYNYYELTTSQVTLQDIDVVVEFTLPLDFASFTATPLSVVYQTSDGVVANNKVDVELYDTTGTAVPLVGGANLVSAAWATAAITFGGAPTFTAGDTVTLRIRPSALTGKYARVSDVTFEYNGK
ncbi:hypothetical protein KKA04_01045 [Patescibacteria group bacterium]|nr:hypothetical protein [Patescibacteria group bacterium]